MIDPNFLLDLKNELVEKLRPICAGPYDSRVGPYHSPYPPPACANGVTFDVIPVELNGNADLREKSEAGSSERIATQSEQGGAHAGK